MACNAKLSHLTLSYGLPLKIHLIRFSNFFSMTYRMIFNDMLAGIGNVTHYLFGVNLICVYRSLHFRNAQVQYVSYVLLADVGHVRSPPLYKRVYPYSIQWSVQRSQHRALRQGVTSTIQCTTNKMTIKLLNNCYLVFSNCYIGVVYALILRK